MEKKKRFNAVDAIVLLIIIAVAGVFVFKFFVAGTISSSKNSTYRLEFFCEEVPSFAAEQLKVGDSVLDEQRESELGEVTDVVLDTSVTYTTDDSGDIRIVPKPGYNSVTLTAEVEGTDYDYGMIVDTAKYGIGHSLTIRVGKAKIFGRVSNIEKLD